MDFQDEGEELQPSFAPEAKCKIIVGTTSKGQSRSNLYKSVAILNLVYVLCGSTFAWSSPMLGRLNLSEQQGSSVAAMLSLGSIMGPLVSGPMGNILGRKYTVGLGMALMTLSWILLTFANHDFTVLSLGRFVAGITIGIAPTVLPMYIAEISENSIRGFLNTLNQVSACIGGLLLYCVGPYVTYATIHYILLGICVVFFLLFPLLPDSPFSFVMKNDIKGARDTLTWLRKHQSPVSIEKELKAIQATIDQNKLEKGSVKKIFTMASNRRAFLICCVLISLQQFSGVSIVFSYTEQIFKMTGTNLSGSVCAIIIAVISTASAFFCPVAVKHFGYKKPLLSSTSGMALGMGGMGVFFLLKSNNVDVHTIKWLPLLSIVVYTLSFNIGFANIPWALAGELFASDIKPQATALIAIISGISGFFIIFSFAHLIELIGLHYLFISFSFFCCFAAVFTNFLVQDTSGLSFIEIQQILEGADIKGVRRKHGSYRIKRDDFEDCKM